MRNWWLSFWNSSGCQSQLTQAVNRLQVSLHQNSQTSSKPPSTDLLQKPEKAKTSQQSDTAKEEPKRKPGGQPGHAGKTRKGNVRIDRYSILCPEVCPDCGSLEFSQQPVGIRVQQVAQLVERPIEVVEYQQHTCECNHCGHYSKRATGMGALLCRMYMWTRALGQSWA